MGWSLVEEPWIPTARSSGVIDRSIRQVFAEAHEIDRLAALPPTVNVAILRQVLLPIVLDALGPPRSRIELAQRLGEGRFDLSDIDQYLDRFSQRFDLFDPEMPFGQVAGLSTPKGEVKRIGLLIPAEASGNNVPLFSPRSEASELALSPAGAARWLVHGHCYDTAAIKSGAAGDPQAKNGKTTGNPTGSVGRFGAVIPIGRNLYETLILNMPIRAEGTDPDDRPWWDRPAYSAEWRSRPATGVLNLLTWQSRRVRLVAEEAEDGPRVTGVVVCAGDRIDPFSFAEPHCTWNLDPKPKPGEPQKRPRRHQSGRASWQGFDSLLAVTATTESSAKCETSLLLKQIGDLWGDELLDIDYPLNVDLVGIEYGNQSAVVENVISDSMPLPVAALREDSDVRPLLDQIAQDADALVKAVNFLEGDLRRSLGSDLLPWDKGQRASARFIHQLDAVVRRLLAGMQRSPVPLDQAVDAWHAQASTLVNEAAEDLLSSVAVFAHQGRVDEDKRRRNVAIAELRFRARVRDHIPPSSDDEVQEVTV